MISQAPYNKFEKNISLALDKFPYFKQITKNIYQRLSYIIYRTGNLQYKLHSDISLKGILFNENNIESFFGYYDKSPWSKKGQYIFHSIGQNNELDISLLSNWNSTPKVIGSTKTWNWQQGAMLQWWKNDKQVIFNDLLGKKLLGSKIIDLAGKIVNQFEYPIQSISPSNNYFVSLNYKRLAVLRPDYGYTNNVNNFDYRMSDEEDGLWVVNTDDGRSELIVSLYQLKNFHQIKNMENGQHKINHAMVSPDGSRIVFMHRWFTKSGKFSRLYSVSPNGDDLFLLLDIRMISHYSWRDSSHLIVWGRTSAWGERYYIIKDKTSEISIIGKGILDCFGDGHPSFSPDKRWVLTDTYPDRSRMQTLLLYDAYHNKLYDLGRFFSPWKYREEYRCDLHPRWSPDGNRISIDSTHDGTRKSYVLDIKTIIENNDG